MFLFCSGEADARTCNDFSPCSPELIAQTKRTAPAPAHISQSKIFAETRDIPEPLAPPHVSALTVFRFIADPTTRDGSGRF